MLGRTVSSDENLKLTEWLKEKRKEQGHTMKSLAQILGVQRTFISKYENQERKLDVIEYTYICNGLVLDPLEGLRFAFGLTNKCNA